MLLTPNWRDWYHFRHQQECHKSGTAFEDYVSAVLYKFHDDFINPNPTGTLGDGGCDGVADMGRRFYACYGQRPGRSAERELAKKIENDLTRALDQWSCFTTWTFVTNAPVGPESTKVFTALQRAHEPGTDRPITLRLWRPEKLWDEVVGTLPEEVLNELFPGAPGIENLELSDLLPLLESLGNANAGVDTAEAVLPVPPTKMDYNQLPIASRMEFNAGRRLAVRIDRWYSDASDPNLYDSHGERFRAIYEGHRAVTTEPAEVLERLYVSVAGPNFRMDGKRANAAFAVVAYFFDSCHVFDTPPVETPSAMDIPTETETPNAASN